MSFRTRALVFLAATPLVAFVLVGGLLGAVRVPVVQQGVPHLRVFQDVARLIQAAYVEPVDIDRVMDGAMRGLADGLDASSAYLSPAEVRLIEANQALPAGDVGLVVSRQSIWLRIVGVRDGSPAQRAGLQSGDFIRAIDDAATRDLSSVAGTRLLRGTPGTTVRLLVIRGNAAEPHAVTLVREVAPALRVSGKRLPAGEGYLRVSSFESGAAAALRTSLASLGPTAGNGVIIDLRDTGDGSPDEGIAAARLFVKSGVLATRAGRDVSKRTITSAAAGDGALTMRVVLLVSNGTAQAAEVFAGALSSNGRATLVGEPTGGLAAVQELVKLPEGYGLWMTAERYVLPDGTPIHGRGLRPDVAVEIPTVGFEETPPAGDPLLDEGVRELHKPAGRGVAPAAAIRP